MESVEENWLAASVTCDYDDEENVFPLPRFIKISNTVPGEAGYMQLKSEHEAKLYA